VVPHVPQEYQDMNPLTNAVLGVLFLVAGVTATMLMYYLRGYPHKGRGKSTGS
jgi:hypothetical protein